MACLKILRVMLPAVQIEEFLIGLDGLGLPGKPIVTDRADKPRSGLGCFQFGKAVHGFEGRAVIIIQIKSLGQIANRVRVLRIPRVHLSQNGDGPRVILQLDIHVADPLGELRILRRQRNRRAF